jgi:glycosyltransferase involved in cell wall biosynthesis
VIPPGANIADVPSHEDACRIISQRNLRDCNLLFVGFEFHRKGLDIAVETLLVLRSSLSNVKLNIVGIPHAVPFRPMPIDPTGYLATSNHNICAYGALNKSSYEERLLLNRLYANATILLVPSRIDCSSMAICDATAFGLPAVTSGAGGIEELIEEGNSGLIAGANATALVYAGKITSLLNDSATYSRLCHGARLMYENRLSWNQHIRRFLEQH